MSCLAGLNNFVTIPVPALNGDGILADVSGLVAEKTIYLSGVFDGEYTLLGSHDDAIFIPIAKFVGDSNRFRTSGPYTLRQDVKATLKSLRVRRAANNSVNIVVAAQAICPCT